MKTYCRKIEYKLVSFKVILHKLIYEYVLYPSIVLPIVYTGDVYDLQETKLGPGVVAAFSEDCTSSMKRFANNQVCFSVEMIIKSIYFCNQVCHF